MIGYAPELLDLYCGAGGLSLGAHLAGFHTKLAIDNDSDLTASFSRNFPNTPQLALDLSTISARAISVLAGSVVGVVGGPPCQGFSDIGRRSAADPRNRLVISFMEIVKAVRPQFFLMENVPGLGSARYEALLDEALSRISRRYTVLPPLVLNAAHYGAATDRSRLVVFGYDPNYVAATSAYEVIAAARVGASTTVRDAISDLPTPTVGGSRALPYEQIAPLSKYARALRKGPPPGLGSAAARKLCRAGLVNGLESTVHSNEVATRFSELAQGERDSISRYPRLHWDRPAPVLRAGTGKDKGSFQAPRPVHPVEPRVISVREAARLQGFPDWFHFSSTKWHSHRMIGNSVSPIFARSVLSLVRSKLEV